MFSSRRRGGGSSGSANQWLLLAGAGLVILAFVARMLLDIGHTRVSDLTGALQPGGTSDSAATTAPSPPADPGAASDTAAPMIAALHDTAESSPAASGSTPAPAPPKPAAPAAPAGTYQVQLGAFGAQGNADKLAARAQAAGFAAQVTPLTHGASTLYAVRVHGLATDAAARSAADSMSRQLGINAVVVPPVR